MKKNFFLLMFFAADCIVYAQEFHLDKKRDYQWMIGYQCGFDPDLGNFTNMYLNFSPDTMNLTHTCRNVFFDGNIGEICDTSGKGYIYTNGVYIADALGHRMPGCTTRIDNGLPIASTPTDEGDVSPQGSLILPMPGNPNKYYVFNLMVNYDIQLESWRGYKLYSSFIDITQNNGMGSVIEYKNILLDDRLAYNGLSACRHANGRDWWILISDFYNKKVYKFLLDATGISLIDIQTVYYSGAICGLAAYVFSPDGGKFIRYQAVDIYAPYLIDVFDFDRATGLLFNQNYFSFTAPYPVFGIGAAISSNSRYLYTTASTFALQYDLEADDVEASIDTVAWYDGFMSPFGSRFMAAALAPDDKIYVGCVNSETVLHTIEHPDSAGLACDFRQHSIQLPAYNIGMPNFPHFRLGPLDGSASDTLGYDGFRWSSAADFGTRYRDKDSTMTVRVTSQQGYPAKVLSHAMRHGSTYSYTAPVFGEYLPKYGTSGDFTVSFDCSTLGEYRDTLDVFTNFGVWSLPISGKVIDPSTPIDSLAVGLYPNPTSGGLTLQLEMPATGKVTMYSAVGQLVRSWSLENVARLEMDLSEYAVGVYFLEIEMGGRKMRVEKVVKI